MERHCHFRMAEEVASWEDTHIHLETLVDLVDLVVEEGKEMVQGTSSVAQERLEDLETSRVAYP